MAIVYAPKLNKEIKTDRDYAALRTMSYEFLQDLACAIDSDPDGAMESWSQDMLIEYIWSYRIKTNE